MSRLLRRLHARTRRGATVVLTVFLMVFVLLMAAFALDIGYMMVVRTQLQVAADSAALAAAGSLGVDGADVMGAAQQFAAYHHAGGAHVLLDSSDVQFGTWDTATATFTQTADVSNSVRITARRENAPFFFARIIGQSPFDMSASAVATANPRDIAFVVDLSGSMNDDTEPAWATQEITNEFTPLGYATVGSDLMQDVYDDFGYGTFPGTLQSIGASLGVANTSRAYAVLTKNGGPLTASSIPATYRILSSDSESTRKQKAYKWLIDNEIAVVMPAALPAPNSSTNYNYWAKYLDYIIDDVTVNSGTGTPPSNRGTLPPSDWSYSIDGLNNPNNDSFPDASVSVPRGYFNLVGYRTYVQFMMDLGRNVKPDGSNYTPLATASPHCPYHAEATAGGTFNFPPRAQPLHACRRSLIAALQVVKERNAEISDPNQKDWVSIITFDVNTPGVVRQALTSNYDAAMNACIQLEAVADNQYSTASENGLIAADNHIKSSAQGGAGRVNANKVVILLTDGMPNLYSSSNSTIDAYISAHPSEDFYGGLYPHNAALMQAMSMELKNWQLFPVGIGLGSNYDFMDRMARHGGTAGEDGQSARGSGNPAEYEQRLTEILEDISTNARVRLVQ